MTPNIKHSLEILDRGTGDEVVLLPALWVSVTSRSPKARGIPSPVFHLLGKQFKLFYLIHKYYIIRILCMFLHIYRLDNSMAASSMVVRGFGSLGLPVGGKPPCRCLARRTRFRGF